MWLDHGHSSWLSLSQSQIVEITCNSIQCSSLPSRLIPRVFTRSLSLLVPAPMHGLPQIYLTCPFTAYVIYPVAFFIDCFCIIPTAYIVEGLLACSLLTDQASLLESLHCQECFITACCIVVLCPQIIIPSVIHFFPIHSTTHSSPCTIKKLQIKVKSMIQ